MACGAFDWRPWICMCTQIEKFTENHFALIADISAEAWSKAAQRWNEVNNCLLDFESEAGETTNQQLQKSRSLYKPTY